MEISSTIQTHNPFLESSIQIDEQSPLQSDQEEDPSVSKSNEIRETNIRGQILSAMKDFANSDEIENLTDKIAEKVTKKLRQIENENPK